MKQVLLLISAILLISAYAGATTYENDIIAGTEEKSDNGLTTVIFTADIHCDGCKKKIEKNMAFEKGVKEIKVDINSKTVVITFKSGKNTPEKLSAALTKLGYENEIKIIK